MGKFNEVFQIIWQRTYLIALIILIIALSLNDFDFEKYRKINNSRIKPLGKFDLGVADYNNSGPCGLIGVKFGIYRGTVGPQLSVELGVSGRKCAGHVRIPRRQRYGCYLGKCGEKGNVFCDEEGDGWISKDVETVGCRTPSEVRHLCCRSLPNLCTWQGVWSSSLNRKDIECDFEPDRKCGKLVCDGSPIEILSDDNNQCNLLSVNGKIGRGKCGMVVFEESEEVWFKKLDVYSVVD